MRWVPLLALFLSCAKTPGTYRLQRTGRDLILLPPTADGVKAAIRLPKARQDGQRGADCDVKSESLDLRWRGRTAEVTLRTGAFDPERLPIPVLAEFQRFRTQLGGLEDKGCLGQTSAYQLATRIAEALPLPPAASYGFRYGSYAHSGFLDLEPQFRLRPIEKGTGYETVFYSVVPEGTKGFRIKLAGHERSIGGKSVEAAAPSTDLLRFAPTLSHFRLFFLTRASSTDYDSIVLAAAGRKTLEESIADPSVFCRSAKSNRFACALIPRTSALRAEMQIHGNGRPVFIPLGGNLREALASAGVSQPQDVLGRLRIEKPFRGKLTRVEFDPAERGVLGITLLGGEHLSW